MALVTYDNTLQGIYSADGSPWIQVGATSSVDFNNLTYSEDGSPFFGIERPATGTSDIKEVAGVAIANVKKVEGVQETSIKKLMGVTN